MKVIDGGFGKDKDDERSDAVICLENFSDLVQEWEALGEEVQLVVVVSLNQQMAIGTNCKSEAHANLVLDVGKQGVLGGAMAGAYAQTEEEPDEPIH